MKPADYIERQAEVLDTIKARFGQDAADFVAVFVPIAITHTGMMAALPVPVSAKVEAATALTFLLDSVTRLAKISDREAFVQTVSGMIKVAATFSRELP